MAGRKTVYAKQIEKQIANKASTDYSSVTDFKLYHYTDAASAFSILTEGLIYPTKMLGNIEENERLVHLSLREPSQPDYVIRKTLNDCFKLTFNSPKFNQLEYAFGFKLPNKLKNAKKHNDPTKIYGNDKKVNLKNIDFILVKRQFKI